MTPVLELEGVTVTGDVARRTMLDDVTFAVYAGESVTVLGDAGAGKSTLAHAVMGTLGPEFRVARGHVRFKGRDLHTLAPAGRRALNGDRIALVCGAAERMLDPRVSVAAQLRDVLLAHRRLPPADIAERTHAALMRAGIDFPDEVLHARPGALAGSQLLRVGVALALMHDPELVIIDALEHVDGTVRAHVCDAITRSLASTNAAVLWMTRDPRIPMRVGGRIAVLYAGRVIEDGSAADLLHHPAHPYTHALLDARPGDPGRRTRLRPPPGDARAESTRVVGCAFRYRCAYAMQACVASPELQVVGGPDARRTVRCHRPLAASGLLPA